MDIVRVSFALQETRGSVTMFVFFLIQDWNTHSVLMHASSPSHQALGMNLVFIHPGLHPCTERNCCLQTHWLMNAFMYSWPVTWNYFLSGLQTTTPSIFKSLYANNMLYQLKVWWLAGYCERYNWFSHTLLGLGRSKLHFSLLRTDWIRLFILQTFFIRCDLLYCTDVRFWSVSSLAIKGIALTFINNSLYPFSKRRMIRL